jgi:hypothetical protein
MQKKVEATVDQERQYQGLMKKFSDPIFSLPKHRPSALYVGAAGLFLLVTAVAAGWLALNFVFPDFETVGIRRVVTRVIIHATILIGLWLGLSLADFSSATRVVVWLAIAVPF